MNVYSNLFSALTHTKKQHKTVVCSSFIGCDKVTNLTNGKKIVGKVSHFKLANYRFNKENRQFQPVCNICWTCKA